MKIEKIEVLCIRDEDEPEVIYILPSGYINANIEVFESPVDLEIRSVSSNKWESEKNKEGLDY